jgi:hypothetical protein
MLMLARAPQCKIVARRKLFSRRLLRIWHRLSKRGRTKGMIREFIDEKWPELMVVLGLGMSCMALVVPLL